ncbi:Uncharacterised protein [Brevundimonas vancanneytii]|uniref:Uncharacterized protein n=1 Tax=Brevundimonas vancanneytii TaxID=1325724 RepID=A0A4P1K2S6_9CAUL|nr:Uncharacterised protein [Brevundimonas vancanneytii]
MPQCATCRHWLRDFGDFGTCKRFPPTPHGNASQNLPQTAAPDWCGEHREKEQG